MKATVEKITVYIEKEDALSIINALNEGLNNKQHFGDDTEQAKIRGASSLLAILNGCFMESHNGVHRA